MRKCRQEEKTKKQILRDRFKSGFFCTRPSGAESIYGKELKMGKIHYLADEEISLKAKGLLSILLCLPDEADKSVTALQEYTSDGAARIKASLIELENFRYIERFRDRKRNGRIGSVKITATPTREAEEK